MYGKIHFREFFLPIDVKDFSLIHIELNNITMQKTILLNEAHCI